MKLGKLAVDRAWVNYRQLREALDRQEEQRGRGLLRRLGEVLVEERIVTASQVRDLLEIQGIVIRRCGSCEVLWNVRGPRGARGRCGACGATLADVPREGPISVAGDVTVRDAGIPAQEGEADPSRQETVQLPSGLVALAGEAEPPAPGDPSPPPAAAPAGSGDRYEIKLMYPVQGGMGRLYLARDRELKRMIILKVLREDLRNAESVRRFITEAQVTAQLQHPNIVPVYDLAVNAEGLPFYTMKQIVGQSFRDIVTIPKGQPTDHTLVQMLQILQSVCNAVHFAHMQGVVHRDLKPGNIIVGAFGEVVVVDWGLAKIIGRDEGALKLQADIQEALQAVDRSLAGRASEMKTLAGTTLGTPAYMAPEQARGDLARIGPATDLYALGAILYEVLACRPPYVGRDSREILDKVLRGPPKPPRAFDPEIPAELEAICLKCLDQDPARRYPTAGALRDDLQAVIEGRGVSIARVGWPVRARRLLQRHAVPVRIAEVAGVVMAVLGWTYSLQWARSAEVRAALRGDISDARGAARIAEGRARVLEETLAGDRARGGALAALEIRRSGGGEAAASARRDLESLCVRGPGLPWLTLARWSLEDGDGAFAEHALSHAQEDPAYRAAAMRLRLARARARRDETGVLRWVREVAALDPTGPEAARARAVQAVGRLASAGAEEVLRAARTAREDLEAWERAYGTDRDLERQQAVLRSIAAVTAAQRFASSRAAPGAPATDWREDPEAAPLVADLSAAAEGLDAYLRLRAEDPELRELALAVARARADGAAELAALDALLSHHPAAQRLWMEIAERAAELGASPRTVRIADDLVRLDPHNPEVRLWRGMLLHRVGEVGRALEDYSWVARMQPERPEMEFLRARALIDLDREGEAETVLTGLLRDEQLRREGAEIWFLRGTARERQGNREGAAADYREAVARAPAEPRYADALARAGAPADGR